MAALQATDYRKRADECVALARAVRTPEQRTMLLHIAETWLRLAKDAAETAREAEAGKPARSSVAN